MTRVASPWIGRWPEEDIFLGECVFCKLGLYSYNVASRAKTLKPMSAWETQSEPERAIESQSVQSKPELAGMSKSESDRLSQR